MRKLIYAVAGAAALSTASLANAAITIVGTSGGNIVVGTPDNVTIPNKVDFDTTTNLAGSTSPWYEFSNNQTGNYIFDLTSSSAGASITLEQLLSGGGSSIIETVTGTGRFLELDTGTLAADTTYRFMYTFNTPSGGGTVSGNSSFYLATVPEPATWAMMLLGFGGIGFAMRRRRRPALAQIA
jgi:hypothetical protein